ncbi:hypothetical protein LTR53_002563 [Teratosphaeriaceae sp. CCFEE 6253]|nr:hypothetical protein LTR53_002563 [Teratosphaeriaceae sp. CCFEE 6253]
MASMGDVEAIGSQCQMPFCRQLDFLPFRCESCKGKFCLDHRTESSHECPHEGEWARRRAASRQTPQSTAYRPTPKPSILTHEQQCSSPSCKTLINTPLVTGVHCETCRRNYCLAHRFAYEHECEKLVPLGARVASGPTQKERGVAALEKLKAWGAAKKAAAIPVSNKKAAAARAVQASADLKKTAKGDAAVPVEKRVYLYVEASSDTLTAKIPKENFYYSADYTIGRMLDLAAKSLRVDNVNNMKEGEEEKLRVFHIEGGKVLGFGEKVGAVLRTGDTIVLVRGIGAG